MQSSQPSNRLVSLDVFRGITIAAMILVNNPGNWNAVYPPLLHAKWHGWTPTDLIFPFFLFIVGVAIVFSFAKRLQRPGGKKAIYGKILRRSLILFSLGLLLAVGGNSDLAHLRIPGVLQRIALVYLPVSILVIHTSVRWQVVIAIGLLLLYWALMAKVPVPGFGAGKWDEPISALSSYLDRLFFTGRMYKETWDPEGLLSTLPSISTALSGVLAGHWLRSVRSAQQKVVGLLLGGAVCFGLGYLVNLDFPINKNLWSSSFVLVTSGLAAVGLGILYWVVDLRGWRKWSWPFLVFGMNAITVYILSSFFAKMMVYNWRVTQPDGTSIALKTWLYQTLFASWASPMNASLFYALSYVFFWFLVMVLFYRKRMFVKI
ncbi:MAG TPA: DUF5009 domain-containing protein [bacterium]|nr:DUF5009 domain-containing protein [bacterium]HNT64585.1 DUF5009 domain-containing protein [bacterium]HOX84572.1 DUF5009 domain-containing protein [bacterium]HPG45295.1 DUF5009 domain-containing protein [bacterium]HPM98986.1 DUF5009 domain-containing protein [bacterium]